MRFPPDSAAIAAVSTGPSPAAVARRWRLPRCSGRGSSWPRPGALPSLDVVGARESATGESHPPQDQAPRSRDSCRRMTRTTISPAMWERPVGAWVPPTSPRAKTPRYGAPEGPQRTQTSKSWDQSSPCAKARHFLISDELAASPLRNMRSTPVEKTKAPVHASSGMGSGGDRPFKRRITDHGALLSVMISLMAASRRVPSPQALASSESGRLRIACDTR